MGNLNDVKYTDYRWLKKLEMKINNNLIENSNLESHSIYSPASMTEMLSIEKKYKYYLENKKLKTQKNFSMKILMFSKPKKMNIINLKSLLKMK